MKLAEYIERAAAKEAAALIALTSASREMTCGEVKRIMEEIPAADVRPVVHARRVKIFDNPWTGKMFTTCTACDGKIGPKDNFCKHCGAMMEDHYA